MSRRGHAVTLLAILAVQLFGAMAFASVCPEPCPYDTEGTSCPPVCALCTSCTHAQQAIVQASGSAAPLMTTPYDFQVQRLASPAQFAADIFHVPLFG